VTEFTLEDAKALIERTKACRPTCSDCTVVSITGPWFHLSQGEPKDFDGLQAALNQAARKHLTGEGWELSHSHADDDGADVFTKRCEKCAAAQKFPWADRLDAEKVLAFTRYHAERVGGAFYLGDLVVTL
jgi:hypothetical protein